ncbi:MAG TPA: hypothetical protein VJY99_15510 [Buttiauxella sp.]|uniref:hypothetical protein n=1 Tax=Buttiauxella sp. TaxID=1972222 RepID=UPI002B48DFB9|nr:hypothetical protein [Buttiauxella sp.]HKM98084.1 hypothetical protein [Buttiauxella sp.]
MKYISVPVSPEAMDKLDYCDNAEGELIDFTISDEQYNTLVSIGLIGLMNTLFDINIDEYEDEKLTGIENLEKAKLFADKEYSSSEDEAVQGFLSQLNKAIEYKTGIFFFF